jgi:hypothetical protein
MKIWNRVRHLVNRRRERELAEELRIHEEMARDGTRNQYRW